MQFFIEDDLRTWILLDNESSVSIFCNPELVKNIRTVTEILELRTNAGTILSTQKCTVPGFGEAWFNPKAVTNILSFAEVSDKFRITYDNVKDVDIFKVFIDKKNHLNFKRSLNKLYFYKPSKVAAIKGNAFVNSDYVSMTNNNIKGNNYITTLAENKEFFTTRQFERAKKARDSFHAVGTPSIPDIQAVLRMNLIKNNPITNDDVKIAANIFGPDVSTIKSKTTRRRPLPVIDDYIEIPRALV